MLNGGARRLNPLLPAAWLGLSISPIAFAQLAAPKPLPKAAPDTISFGDGDQLKRGQHAQSQGQPALGRGHANLLFPVYRKLSCSITSTDNYLGDPPQGYLRNTFHFTAGATMTLK